MPNSTKSPRHKLTPSEIIEAYGRLQEEAVAQARLKKPIDDEQAHFARLLVMDYGIILRWFEYAETEDDNTRGACDVDLGERFAIEADLT